MKFLTKALSFIVIITMIFTSVTPVFAIENTEERSSIDEMLLKSQQWLNSTYSTTQGFGSVIEDGKTRYDTVNACIRALQLELGITQTANNFGSGTITRFNATFPNGIQQQEFPSTVESNIYGILQCALWTKGGYSIPSSTITKHFYDGVGNAIKNLKLDMGFANPNSTVTVDIMKSLLSMDQFKTIYSGNSKIREIENNTTILEEKQKNKISDSVFKNIIFDSSIILSILG